MSGGSQATGGEEAPGGATSRAKAGRTEEVRGSSRVRVKENSRNGAARDWEQPELFYPEGSQG